MLNLYVKYERPDELPGKEVYKKMILARGHESEIWQVTRQFGERWPEAETYIMKDEMKAIRYAKDIIKSGWQEQEQAILKDYIYRAEQQYEYEVEAEEDDLDFEEDEVLTGYRDYLSEYYKGKVMPNSQELLFQHPIALYDYIVNVYKKPWSDAEPYLKQSPDVWKRYFSRKRYNDWD
jgi:hypothetical protein